MLKISNGHRDNVGVWIDGGIHAREWITPAVVTYLADQVTKNYKNNLPYFTNKDWSVVKKTLTHLKTRIATYISVLSCTNDKIAKSLIVSIPKPLVYLCFVFIILQL